MTLDPDAGSLKVNGRLLLPLFHLLAKLKKSCLQIYIYFFYPLMGVGVVHALYFIKATVAVAGVPMQ